MKLITQTDIDAIMDDIGCDYQIALNWAHKETLRQEVFDAKTFDDLKLVFLSIIRKADFSKAGTEV